MSVGDECRNEVGPSTELCLHEGHTTQLSRWVEGKRRTEEVKIVAVRPLREGDSGIVKNHSVLPGGCRRGAIQNVSASV